MYKITSNGNAAYSETCVWIALHGNGSYVEVPAEEASGVCVKVPVTYTTEREDGSGEVDEVETVADKVFRLEEIALYGTEPIVDSIEVVSMQEYMDATMGDMVSTDEIDAILNGGA